MILFLLKNKLKKLILKLFFFFNQNGVKKEEMTPLIVEYVMNNPKWRVSLQTHKYLNIP